MTSRSGCKVAIVAPVINEAENLRSLLPLLRKYDVVIVDDGSTDGSCEVAGEFPNVTIVERGKKGGLVSAIIDGFRNLDRSKYDRIVVLDSDFSHDPSKIDDMIEFSMENKLDLVIGSRYITNGKNNDHLTRKIISKVANFSFRSAFSSPIRDATSGFRVYSIRAVEFIIREDSLVGISPSYAGQTDIVRRLSVSGFRIGEYPIVFRARERGKSKLSVRDAKAFLSLILWKGYVLRYVLVGITGILVNEIVLKILFGYMGSGAEVISIESSLLSNFVLNDRLTFGSQSGTLRHGFVSRLARYNLYNLGGVAINLSIFLILIHIGIGILLSNLIGILAAFLFTYFASTFSVWRTDLVVARP
ncbi:MAG TPA: glycosyltransferase [Thermoplasmataceae archaeon]|nr:glycosyltransferase [Thermoplasmataceae archaeon]